LQERIKMLRKTLNLTQQEFGKRIGTTQNAIGNYEIGHRSPSSSVINNICKTFSVNEEWLRTGEGEMFLETSDNVLDLLAAKYNLSQDVRALVGEFVNLKPDIQQAFVDYALKVARSIANDTDVSDAVLQSDLSTLANVPTTEPDDEDAALKAAARKKADAYYEQLLLEASTGTSGASTQARAG